VYKFIASYVVVLFLTGWSNFIFDRMVYYRMVKYFRMNLVKNISKFDEVADRFELLPMYFMTFHGQENIRRVIEVRIL